LIERGGSSKFIISIGGEHGGGAHWVIPSLVGVIGHLSFYLSSLNNISCIASDI
jgi:hypothetical protein